MATGHQAALADSAWTAAAVATVTRIGMITQNLPPG
jgi:hypothetical protein